MGKIYFYSLVVGLFVFTACSKNSDNGPNSPTVDKTANLKGTGESANDILSIDKFDKLLVEIAHVKGFRPTDEAMANFIAYLTAGTFKQDIRVIFNELDSPGKEKLTLEEIAELESQNRTAYNSGTTLAIYIYFADAPADSDQEEENLVTLGAVYRNTSMVIHEVTVRKLAGKSPFLTDADVETPTINHEFGHLLGLVDLGSAPVNAHEDTEAANHCSIDGCLMQAELQFGVPINKSLPSGSKNMAGNGLKSDCSLSGYSVLQMLEKQMKKGLAPNVRLDEECILDLRANGGR